RVRYDVWANTAQAGFRPDGAGTRGCSSMVERQLPKLIVRVRFPSPALFLSFSSADFDHPFDRLPLSVVCWPSVPSTRTFSLLEWNLRTKLCWFGEKGGDLSFYPNFYPCLGSDHGICGTPGAQEGVRYRGIYKAADGRYRSAGTFSTEKQALAVAEEAERHAAEVAGGTAGGLDR